MTNPRSTLRISALFHARGFASQEDYRAYRREFLLALLQEQAELPEIPERWHEAVNARAESETSDTEEDVSVELEPDSQEVLIRGAKPAAWPWVVACAALLIAGFYYYSSTN